MNIKQNDENTFARQGKVFNSQPGYPLQQTQPTFNIFVDDQKVLQELKPVNIQHSEPKLQLTDDLVCLQRNDEPISTAIIDPICLGENYYLKSD